MNLKGIWSLLRETFQKWNADKAPRLAAALSYYTIFSLAPLLVLIIAITGFIVGNNATIRDQILTQVQGLVGQQGAQIVNTLITNSSKPRSGIIATVIGLVTLILGATGVFGQLQESLNTIWEVTPKEGGGIGAMAKHRFLSFAMVVGLAFLLLVSFVISTALSVIGHFFTSLLGGASIIASILNYAFSIAVITVIFAAIFTVLPDVKISWKDVWIGALVTSILFIIGQFLISLYLGSSAATSVYGAAGSLVVLLLWVYYSAQILFMGAEFTQVYATRTGSEIAPSDNARFITDTELAHQGITSRGKGQPQQQQRRGSVGPGPVENIQQVMIPVAGQPAIHPSQEEGLTPTRRERVRYEPPNPNTVIPVIAAGTAAGIYTLTRVIRKVISQF